MLPRQAKHVSTKEIDGQTMVLDRQNGKLHELNASASLIWHCSDGRTSVDEIVAATASAYGMEPADVERDVLAALQEFEKLQLIEWVTSLDPHL